MLSKHSLPQFDPKAALQILKAVRPTVPLIVVAGAADELAVVELVRAGVEESENLAAAR